MPTEKPKKSTTRFRELMARKTISILPAVGDPFSARIVAAEGYEAVMTSGNGSSAMQLGIPDIGLMTLSENAANAGLPKQVREKVLQLLPDIGAARKLGRRVHGKGDAQGRNTLYVLAKFSGLEPEDLVPQRTVDGLQRMLCRHQVDINGEHVLRLGLAREVSGQKRCFANLAGPEQA